MGLFLQAVLFPGGGEIKPRSRVQVAAQNKEYAIRLAGCRWHQFDKGPAVLLNDGCLGYEALAGDLSAQLNAPVMLLYIYDDDLWGYYLYESGQELDRFATFPGYFAPGDPPDRPGNAVLVARIFGVEETAIGKYLVPWPTAMDEYYEEDVYAYDGDFYAAGDCWQMTDFMKALGFDYDLLDPQPQPDAPAPPHQTVPVTPTTPHYASSGPLPDSEVLPDALTHLPYALERAAEVEDVAGEAAEHIRNMQYQSALPLLTDAILAHPDRAALYILRAFCWSQLEGLMTGMSRRPDMDRDLAKALELEPDNVMILRARCPTTATTSRYKRHIEDLTRLIQLDPDHWDTYLTSRAYRYHWVGDDPSAKADLAELVRRKAKMTVDLSYLLRELPIDWL